jgi:hypothetical protein
MVILYYEHDKRRISVEVKDGDDREIGIERAKKYIADHEVEDHNIAFWRLMQCDWDMEKVDRHYRNEDK